MGEAGDEVAGAGQALSELGEVESLLEVELDAAASDFELFDESVLELDSDVEALVEELRLSVL